MKMAKQNFVVCKASAGSGKTFKLVNEYLKLCFASSSPFKFRKILAITFTNKAAAEMKERIIQHLHALSSEKNSKDFHQGWMSHYEKITGLSENTLQEKSKLILTSILHDYSSFSISTIDKFTHKIIRNFARDLKLSSDFEIEMDAEFSLEKTVDEVISLAGTDKEVTETLINYINYLLYEEDNWKIENNLKIFSKELLNEGSDENLELLNKIEPEDFKKIIDLIHQYCKEEEIYLHNLYLDFQKICNENSFTIESFHYTTTGPYKLFQLIQNRKYDEIELGPRIEKALNEETIFHSSIRKSIDTEIQNLFIDKFNDVRAWIENKRPKYISYRLLHKNLYNLSLINKLSEKLKEVNTDENIVFMSEFNRIISDVIKNDPAPFIYERIGERYNHILIDEFQDTSELQFANLIPLIENSLGNGYQCLLVGDPKQAIYRWRGGDVDQFINLPKLANHQYAQDTFSSQFLEEQLTHNFRSGKNIVEFNNQFFNLACSSLQEKYQSIYKGLNQESVKENGYVELEIISNEAENKSELMLENIVKRIRESLSDGFTYNDICIITRGNKEGSLIAEKLHREKIPVISKDSLFLKNSSEVELVMNFIKYLAFPKDKYAGFKVIELYQKLFVSENTPIDFYESFKIKSSVYNAEKFLKSVQITYSRNYLLNQNSYQLTDEIIKLFFKNNSSIYITFLQEYIFNEWQKQPMAIHELCLWWEDKKDKLSIQSTENIDAVKIMTIHSSKGLQFPVVIFPYASWKIKNSKSWLWINLDKNEYPIETFLVKSDSRKLDHTNFSELKKDEKSKSNLDDLNLLYVAFTRPEARLYLLSFDDNNLFKQIKPNLTNSLNQHPSNELIYFKGEKIQNSKTKKEYIPSQTINYLNDIKWDERLRLSLTPNKNSDEKQEEFELKIIGITMHHIFEKTNDIHQAIELLNRIQKQDKTIEKFYDQIKSEIKNAYEHPIIKNLNTLNNNFNEATIISVDGKSYRPDKIYIAEKNVTILDYKTGAKKEEHAMQLYEYADLFKQIGYVVENKYLYYTKEAELLII